MNDKQKRIIDAALKLFAVKGYSSTSVQEIATEASISKGAFYLSFKSKDTLLYSIFQYYFDTVQNIMNESSLQTLEPREKFCHVLYSLIDIFCQHKEIITMQIREAAIPLNNEVKELLMHTHLSMQMFYRDSFLAIYGKDIQPHIWDLTLIFDGIYQSFTRILIMDSAAFNTKELVHYLLRRMDSIVLGLSGEQILMTDEKVHHSVQETSNFLSLHQRDLTNMVAEMREVILDFDNKSDLEISLDVLEAELNKETPRIPVIKGMLSNFEHVDLLNPYRKKIIQYFQITI